ncbi:flotillin [Pseudomonas nitritireducens]|uniref:Flotillin n=1 Tax=Pseudomonas nitroreducens TaxID=46680 RepID=A0A7W7KQJ9_PSENT|nr:flotillin family protein [Pseudomonas nitritireducens]MBB4867162.1 flotillin [Pseudomonas nitritireducens]
MSEFALGLMPWVMGLGFIIFTVVCFMKQYRLVPNDEVMVVYGGLNKTGAAKIIKGGSGTFIIPFIQQFRMLSLAPRTVKIDLENTLSADKIRVNVPSVFTYGVGVKEPEVLQDAARLLLDMNTQQVDSLAISTITGSLRQVIADLSIEELIRDRDTLIKRVEEIVGSQLRKVGLVILNSNITDITDSSGFIDAIGQKAASQAVNQAKIEVAEQTRKGEIGVQEHNTERMIGVAKQKTGAELGVNTAERDRMVGVAKLEAETVNGKNMARAEMADSNATLQQREAAAYEAGEVRRAQAESRVADEQRQARQAELGRDSLPKAEIERQEAIIAAEAEASVTQKKAEGEAAAIFARYEAEARGQQKVYDAQAAGFKAIVDACGGNADAAIRMILADKSPILAEIQAKALSNLNIGNVTVWDSGSGSGDGEDGALKRVTRDFLSMIPAAHGIAKEMGVSLPSFLGQMLSGKGEVNPDAPPPPVTEGEVVSEQAKA